ncbi:cystathionine gamma-lyase [Paracoccidioides lutzii Pb01]|uniref:Cystathionine gamma-lyase n=1 Tax=Paracoccidioides lutzii (strain ATCC MYA-826 / Pb01) TaxID=502779 RepID=C1H7U4_PARBA|nr:cystathionine gamma-lyase [Paracoccidioides lutzii Pb01]EEH36417.1 cystathionine gamma-lyase [Paracoccidioides lutzii Pb01]
MAINNAESLSKVLANNLNLPNEPSPATLALHADDSVNVLTDVAPPLHLSTTFRYSDNPEDLIPWSDSTLANLPATTHIYSRHTAPNTTRFETILSSLLHGHVIAYSSGLAALHAALVFLNPRRISVGYGYHGSHGVIDIQTRLNGLVKLPLNCDPDELQKGDAVLVETPINPHGTVFDIQHYADKAHARGAYLIVDSTFGPPGLQDPFLWGADLVLHSGSKYLGGHSDILCGVLVTKSQEWKDQLLVDRLHLGSVMGNMEGWLGVRSLRTLEVRVQRQSANAERLVRWIAAALSHHGPVFKEGSGEAAVSNVVESISHASLQEEAWVRRQMPNGFGPVFSITLKEVKYARLLPTKLRLFHHATSLGGVESLIEWRAMTDPTVDQRLLRISVGLEDWKDLKEDLMQAMRGVLEG